MQEVGKAILTLRLDLKCRTNFYRYKIYYGNLLLWQIAFCMIASYRVPRNYKMSGFLYNQSTLKLRKTLNIPKRGRRLNMPNVNSGIIKPSIKQEIFDSNRDLFDIIYFLGTGFMLSDHIYAYGKAIYDLSEKSITRKLINMCGKGLLLEKEATTTGTKIYVLSKYVKSKYESKPSQNVSSVKITERKLWKNLYMNEYIIQRVVRYLLKNGKEISIQRILDLLEENFITFQTTQNRQDVFALYEKFYDKFMCGSSEPFMQDFNALAADLYLFGKNFLKAEMDIDYSEQIRQRKIRQLDKDAYKNEEDKNKYFYNLYQFVMQGFFFNGLKEDVIQIGLFEIGKLTFEKIYKQICYIILMLE